MPDDCPRLLGQWSPRQIAAEDEQIWPLLHDPREDRRERDGVPVHIGEHGDPCRAEAAPVPARTTCSTSHPRVPEATNSYRSEKISTTFAPSRGTPILATLRNRPR